MNHNTFGHAALKAAAYIVLLNAMLTGCASSSGNRQHTIGSESEIYKEVAVQGPVSNPGRVRRQNKFRKVAGVSQAAVLYGRSIYIDPINLDSIPDPERRLPCRSPTDWAIDSNPRTSLSRRRLASEQP